MLDFISYFHSRFKFSLVPSNMPMKIANSALMFFIALDIKVL